ncbi:cytochrome c1 [Puniceibacterium sediminis]|uniref:Cytochrome c1 n=1 Tax=Puniceibacterium sediminis TaxID=1608407 RepID=A0A238WPF9_9RHOB|nr:cytochrome c1 [Puniceibacterium sediminis]SNR48203.1 ubiquinol-cytochrome c reductase cytochrome c1 subunit [Puniceibacterium sediminis]
MFKKLALTAAMALALTTAGANAAEVESHVEDFAFSFEGPFGSYDQHQLQRGLQVYTEVCSACHGLRYVPLRDLSSESGPGLPEDQVRAYAAQNFEVFDAELDDFRPATPADHFPANTGVGAPDLSLMAKSRAGFHGPYGTGINQLLKGIGGPEYIASLLNGYEEAPSCAPEDFDGHYNTVFAAGGYPDSCKDEDGHHMYPGSWIAMGQPLYGDDVEYADGHESDVHHEAMDVSAFLMWAAEPKMMARKQAGFVGVLFLTLLSVLLYLTNKRIWAPIKGKKKHA